GGGGGGVAAIIEEVKDFSLSPGSITAQLALGSAKAQQIRVKNTGNAALSFNLNVLTVSDFVSLSETGFRLEPGQEKTLEANVIGRKLGSYIGQIETVGNEIKKYTDIIIEVESEQVLFDAKIDIPSAYKEVEAGGELRAQITLLNVGPPRKVDVTTTFIIKDRQGNFVYESSETFAVERQKSFVKSFKLPKDIKPGDYLAIVEVRYENSFAVSSELFRVVSKKEIIVPEALKSGKVLLYALFIFAGLVFLFVSLLVPKIKIGVGEKAKLRKCSMIIAELEEAIAKKDIAKAEKLYVKARKLYVDLKTKDKRKLYQKLVSLYKKMR
ncbi:hypothetical protein HYY71_06410, partial [Candidatus Woesearchaeota archaeon]|nr:hypothetical protein [Candidatus Woesearchaeota archaeon]